MAVDDDKNDQLFLKLAFAKSFPAVSVHFLSNGRDALDYLTGAKPYTNRKKYPMPHLLLLDLKCLKLVVSI